MTTAFVAYTVNFFAGVVAGKISAVNADEQRCRIINGTLKLIQLGLCGIPADINSRPGIINPLEWQNRIESVLKFKLILLRGVSQLREFTSCHLLRFILSELYQICYGFGVLPGHSLNKICVEKFNGGRIFLNGIERIIDSVRPKYFDIRKYSA